MRCKNARILISASMDGELTQREERELRRHIHRCSECAREQAEVSNLRDVMSVWADEEPSEWLAQSFAYRLQDEMERRPARRTRKPRRVFGTAVAGFATALLAFGIILYSQLVPQSTVPSKPAKPAGVVRHAKPHKPTAPDNRVVATKPESERPARPADNISQPAPTPTPRPDAGTVRTTPDRTPGPATTIVRTFKPVRDPNRNRIRPTAPSTTAADPTPLPGRIVAANAGATRNTRPYLSARGSSGREAEVKRMVMRNIMLASHAEVDTESEVVDQLAKADLAMNESVEEVRGILRKAADNLARSENRVEMIRDF